MTITFRKASLRHKYVIFEWLDKPHVKEFWDNSPEHREDIVIFMNARKEPSSYFDGIFSYWVGCMKGQLYCFLITSPVTADSELPPLWRDHRSKTGSTYNIDFCIGNEAYLGKRLAAPTLEAFTQWFQEEVDQTADTFFIDPDEDNPRASHVYTKAGFETVGEFIMQKGVFEGQTTLLMVKKMGGTI